MALSVHFLGVGSAGANALGNASLVLEQAQSPLLLIDCGFTVPSGFEEAYGRPPPAVFLTHLHLDHAGGLEALFYRLRFGGHYPLTKLFVPAPLIPALQSRLADYPGQVAEGGSNFWDVFQLCPVSDRFWLDDLCFRVFPTRHHLPGSAWGLALPGQFFYSGDTRPIPEQVVAHASQGERIFHDCALTGNPSHTGLEDLLREYTDEQRRRMVVYHYHSSREAAVMRERGLQVANPGDRFDLSLPGPVRHAPPSSTPVG
ncbi:MBL fold metallo-hydrolase [Mangrovitalea sediminis]|uniref:MBL fold metallo-hydrolase n=1 Tax=Mangrovitalea sediminis TaxID=1982043 RepID=UPI000BE4DEC7|nr:MBL fold metallo-hydrolase [Mangrovitalea sediminis]